ncbi:MAG: hypothetical protein U9N49_12095 [Campylobacterota bacterium]|nr:hypothetical protein [Campylobacterota bacterium]
MKTIKEMSMPELAGYVCSKLEAKGIQTVLSGGCCVEIYSKGKYTSDDIDLIDRFNGGHREIKEVMIALGFEEYNRYFRHIDTPYFIEFPRGPLSVGFKHITDTASKEYETGILKLLTPTDCIKDRLAAYFHWDDLQSLDQALWVAQQNEIDLDAIEEWSKAEMEYDKFMVFKKRV